MSSNPVPLKTRRVGQRCTLNLSRADTSSRWCGVVVRRGVPAQVSSTSLDHGSKLRGPSSKAHVQLNRWPSGYGIRPQYLMEQLNLSQSSRRVLSSYKKRKKIVNAKKMLSRNKIHSRILK
ncbi:uncharacterized protein TNCV_4618051 [Trichonephila clavipes]|nr:uncharacterized protein TNCV_4618051 [Trichonephila clavipes]